MTYRNLLCYLLFLIFIFGCASTTLPKYIISPNGEPSPEPHYVLRDSEGLIQVTFYYSSVIQTKDLDGSFQPISKYLDKNISHALSLRKCQTLILTMKVFNPRSLKYRIYANPVINYRGGGSRKSIIKVAISNLFFRSYEFPLVLDEGISTAKINFYIQSSDGRTLIRTGDFNYSINL